MAAGDEAEQERLLAGVEGGHHFEEALDGSVERREPAGQPDVLLQVLHVNGGGRAADKHLVPNRETKTHPKAGG